MSDLYPQRLIALHDLRHLRLVQSNAAWHQPSTTKVAPLDLRQRALRDLRISVTDRCNFRCNYCMPKEVFDKQYRYLAHSALLSFEEITRLSRQFANLGVQKIRLTGGEPLLRKNVEQLIEQLAGLRTPDGQALDLAISTNGALLARKAKALKSAGLQRVTVSLDALDDAVFGRMNDVDFPVAAVLDGIEAAQQAGLGPIKINMVVKRGNNEDQILPMARYFRGRGLTLRFIEYMDVGNSNGWRMQQVLPSADIIELIQSELALVPLKSQHIGETAQRWGYANAQGHHDPQLGEIGVISSVSQAFCSDCNRARLSTEGRLYLCLFAQQGFDLRQLLRSNASDSELAQSISQIWRTRQDNYSEQRQALSAQQTQRHKRVEMSYIGG